MSVLKNFLAVAAKNPFGELILKNRQFFKSEAQAMLVLLCYVWLGVKGTLGRHDENVLNATEVWLDSPMFYCRYRMLVGFQ